ncbi:hypothetical protein [Allonocardiopsis opalescens]|uniref:Uncharacterized protein n=1 Tax=Allonocardiopsis opalescens TaxID=1144618 RepID=A0A2T0PVI7_9ACTN|nr:hypothetical protein [Allonocardiopsis opalescens]PRX95556.1 hypothetical protein CLV72_109165 [Allonocardiopsis opalescens]
MLDLILTEILRRGHSVTIGALGASASLAADGDTIPAGTGPGVLVQVLDSAGTVVAAGVHDDAAEALRKAARAMDPPYPPPPPPSDGPDDRPGEGRIDLPDGYAILRMRDSRTSHPDLDDHRTVQVGGWIVRTSGQIPATYSGPLTVTLPTGRTLSGDGSIYHTRYGTPQTWMGITIHQPPPGRR